MKITLNWLKEYIKTDLSVDEIAEKLTAIGLEVEDIIDNSKDLNSFFIAEIIATEDVANSTKLKLCQVRISQDQILPVICGAKNARAGMKIIFAPIGSIIPSNKMQIKKAKIAGIESNGMICSASELQIENIVNDNGGIVEIDNNVEIGTKIVDLFQISDVVIEINITPNRGDCLGIIGIARELVASGIASFTDKYYNDIKYQYQHKNIENNIKINNLSQLEHSEISELPDYLIINDGKFDNISHKMACQFFSHRVIRNIKNCQSPKWLQDRLLAIGINSISAIVDVINYTMIIFNQPMHCFDANKIGDEITIRFAKNNEEFISLKEEKYLLTNQDLVISTNNYKNNIANEKIISLAGIIGGIDTACDINSNDIIIESANFNHIIIANSGRKHNINSDSRYRFERNIDDSNIITALDFATNLIIDICGNIDSKVSNINLIDNKYQNKIIIDFNINNIRNLIGIEPDITSIESILHKLSFKIIKRDADIDKNIVLTLEIPSFRKDVSNQEDIIEEIIRILGYHHIKSQPIILDNSNLNIDNSKKIDNIRLLLANKGCNEVITWSFIDYKIAEMMQVNHHNLIIANPISSEMNYMRPTLAIGMINSYYKNYLRGCGDLSLFEIGNIFNDKDCQQLAIGIVRSGKDAIKNHYQPSRNFDVFDIKQDVINICEILDINPKSLIFSKEDLPAYYHPYRSARVMMGKKIIAHFGEIHPKISKYFDIKNNINFGEVFLTDDLLINKLINKKSFTFNDLPMVERDFAFIINKDVALADMLRSIENIDKTHIKKVNIFDIYDLKQDNVHSVALKVFLQPQIKTFTNDEIESISQRIINDLLNKYQAKIRSNNVSNLII